MQEVIAWATFAGAWLLVAGPLYQGSAELAELDFDREGIQGAAAAVEAARTRPSAWWWLLPPAMYVLHRRWFKALRQAMLPQLTQTQREQVTRFQSKSTGWFTVAAGAALLAMGETWQITQHYRWPVWAFWLLVTVMLAAAVLTTTVLMIGDARMRRAGTAETAPAAEQRLGPGHLIRRRPQESECVFTCFVTGFPGLTKAGKTMTSNDFTLSWITGR